MLVLLAVCLRGKHGELTKKSGRLDGVGEEVERGKHCPPPLSLSLSLSKTAYSVYSKLSSISGCCLLIQHQIMPHAVVFPIHTTRMYHFLKIS